MGKEFNQIALFVTGKLGTAHKIEEFDRIIERQQSPVLQIRWRLLDTAQPEGPDSSLFDLLMPLLVSCAQGGIAQSRE